MKVLFVNLKSELTTCKDLLAGLGNKTIRTRTECNCPHTQNRRDAIVAYKADTILCFVIRCKACKKFWEELK